jgi:D-3-phosphoglycerate dehydrogenase / 2-oxoglutarate reductase
VLGEAGLNIAQMHNASRGEVAYTLVDVDAAVDAAALQQIAGLEGILSLRAV